LFISLKVHAKIRLKPKRVIFMEPALEVVDKLSRPKLRILSIIGPEGLTAAEASEKFSKKQSSALRDLRELERIGLLKSQVEKGETGPPRARFFPRKFELTVKINDGRFVVKFDLKED